MPDNKTPQPITRAEFEAGVKFYTESDLCTINSYHLTSICDHSKIILDKKGSIYCHIQFVENDGFNFIQYIFHFKVEGKVFFKNCYKTLTK